jgi:penicillin-binding protein 2
MRLVGFAVIALFALLVTRLWSLQVLNARRYESLAVATTERVVPEPAPRGLIVSRSGKVLAGDVALEEIEMSEQSAAAHLRALVALAALLDTSERSLDAKLSSNQYYPYQSIPLATNPSPEALAYIEQNPSEFPGVKVTTAYLRHYPAGDVGAQVLGYVGPVSASELKTDAYLGNNADSIVGQAGLEEECDRVLQGRPGEKTEEVNTLGDVVQTRSDTPGRIGDTVVTHLSLSLEQQLQSDLASEVAALRGGTTSSGAVVAPWAAGVVLDVRDGAGARDGLVSHLQRQ